MDALDRVDPTQLDLGMRVIELERQLAESREDLVDMRCERDALREIAGRREVR